MRCKHWSLSKYFLEGCRENSALPYAQQRTSNMDRACHLYGGRLPSLQYKEKWTTELARSWRPLELLGFTVHPR